MKKLLLVPFVCLCYINGFSQQIARSCGGGCDDFSVTTRSNNGCGGGNADKVFKVVNNTNQVMHVELFDKQQQINSSYGYHGHWKSDGYATIAPGNAYSFESCGSTGENIVFYREEGAHDRFPSQDQVDEMAGDR